MFDTLFSYAQTSTSSVQAITPVQFLVAVAASLALGFALAGVYCFRSRYTKSFVITMATLPAIVAVVIMMVNGDLGAGVAVAGAFSLVRFRSVPGQARDSAFVFLAMALGLVCGMGCIGYGILILAIIGGANLLMQLMDFGGQQGRLDRTVRITCPEDLDYTGLFEPVLDRYATSVSLVSVKTANMGSLYKLVYNAQLTSADVERALIDELRCRNGNLEIAISHQEVAADEL